MGGAAAVALLSVVGLGAVGAGLKGSLDANTAALAAARTAPPASTPAPAPDAPPPVLFEGIRPGPDLYIDPWRGGYRVTPPIYIHPR